MSSHDSIQLLGQRSEPAILNSEGKSVTKAYLVSDPLPRRVHDIRIIITASNQGYASDPDGGLWAWFEVSLLRRSFKDAGELTSHARIKDELFERPEDFEGTLSALGWNLVPLKSNHTFKSLNIATVSLTEQASVYEVYLVQEKETTTEPNSIPGIVEEAEEGDVLVIWARCQFKGWQNRVRNAKIELRTQDSRHACYPSISAVPEEHTDRHRKAAMRPFYLGASKVSAEFERSGHYSFTPEQSVVRQLQDFFQGEWILCGHECTSIDHGHDVEGCEASSGGPEISELDDTQHRGVYNPCHHYLKESKLESLRRLLLVCRSDLNQLPEVILITTGLNTDSGSPTLHYVCLSYCWGDLQQTKRIMLNHVYRYPSLETGLPGICFRHPYNITDNLHDALCRIRETCLPWPMWIDALGIDQTDTDERNAQVSQMGEIYAKADVVWVWLNESEQLVVKTYHVIRGMRQVLEQLATSEGTEFNPYTIASKHLSFLDVVKFSGSSVEIDEKGPHHQADLDEFFHNQWFRRVWVLQEVFRSNVRACVLPAFDEPLMFSDVLVALNYNRHNSQYLRNARLGFQSSYLWYSLCSRMKAPVGAPVNRLRVVPTADGETAYFLDNTNDSTKGEQAESNMDILNLFGQAMPFSSTDQRDKLYALLGLAREFIAQNDLPCLVQPNYRKHVSDVFVDFTRFCILQTKTLQVLSVVVMAANQRLVEKGPQIPEDYQFPPACHPTWSLWPAAKERWFEVIGAIEPRYNNMSCMDDGINTILGNDYEKRKTITELDCINHPSNTRQLKLDGVQLDEIDVVFRICFRDHRQTFAFIDEKMSWEYFTIHRLWEAVLAHARQNGLLTRTTHHDDVTSSDYTWTDIAEACLFDEFLLTIFCDRVLFRKKDGLPRPDSERLRPSFSNELMHDFIPYWISTHPRIGAAKSALQRFEFDAELPPFVPADLPQPVADYWQPMMPEFAECNIKGHKRNADMMMHHILGNWVFISKGGRLGICPYGTRAGDALVAFWGAKHVSVLRPDQTCNLKGSVSDVG